MYSLEPIGLIESPYREKFSVPRQPGLVTHASAKVKLVGPANCLESVRDIEQFSHLWLLFLFDKNLEAGWKPTVRPPRLGGNQRIGVFASRATFRPNGIGMSAVELIGVSQHDGHVYLEIAGVDLVDGTPIIDIKPYVPYSDSIPGAKAGYAQTKPDELAVIYLEHVQQQFAQRPDGAHEAQVISQVLAQDPRPAYKEKKLDDKEYAVYLFDLNVKFRVSDDIVTVTAIEDF